MYNLVKMELYNLKKLKSYKIVLIISLIISMFSIITYSFDPSFKPTGLVTYNNRLWDTPLMMIYAGIFSGLFVGADFNYRTNSLQVARGHSRKSIVLSKLIVYLIGCIPLFLLDITIVTIFYTVRNGWGVTFDITQVIYIIKTLLLSIFLNLSSATVFFMLAYLLKDIAKTSIVSIVGYMLSSVLLGSFGVINKNLDIYKYTTFEISRNVSDIVKNSSYTLSIVMGIFTIAMMIFLSVRLFNKAELK